MTQEHNPPASPAEVPQAVVKTKKSFSIVWLVPLVAILIGGSLIYKAVTEKGPEITISFKTAEGLEAGKTKIKYKDVDIGQVDAITIGEDLSHVKVSAELAKGAAAYLTDKTRFWVVRARVSSGAVSGLGTIFGGAYIAMDPREDGTPAREFVGLEAPPVISTNEPGRKFRLQAERLGSVQQGTLVYYRQIEVGKVESYTLAENGQDVNIEIFIHEPYHEYVRKNTRFWNASGFDVTLGAEGLQVNTESILSIMSGGLAFENLSAFDKDEPVEEDQVFILHESLEAAREMSYSIKQYWSLIFKGSVRGLKPGAPVELKGMMLGKVMDIDMLIGDDPSDVAISVLIETEPERLAGRSGFPNEEAQRKFVDSLVAHGLRAQLKTGSLLTGALFVDLDFHDNTPVAKMDWEVEYPVFPTIPKSSEAFLDALQDFTEKLQAFPVHEIGDNLQAIVANLKKTTQQISGGEVESIIQNVNSFTGKLSTSDVDTLVENLNKTIQDIGVLIEDLNTGGDGEIVATLSQTQKTLAAVEQMLRSDSAFSQESIRALKEVADAAGRIRALADYLERHPNSLIYGKGE
jgi:paraquat-inducible protein B